MELAALAATLYVVGLRPIGGLFGAILLLALQAATAFLIHCPAHYVVGYSLGIRFRRVSLGSSTIADAFPPSLRTLGRLLPVLRLSVNRESMRTVSQRRLKTMYLSGVVASVGSSIIVAAAITLTGDILASVLTWSYAMFYLCSNIFLSPKAGDLMRAKMVSKDRTGASL